MISDRLSAECQFFINNNDKAGFMQHVAEKHSQLIEDAVDKSKSKNKSKFNIFEQLKDKNDS